jgi:hypothetical protein
MAGISSRWVTKIKRAGVEICELRKSDETALIVSKDAIKSAKRNAGRNANDTNFDGPRDWLRRPARRERASLINDPASRLLYTILLLRMRQPVGRISA